LLTNILSLRLGYISEEPWWAWFIGLMFRHYILLLTDWNWTWRHGWRFESQQLFCL